MAPLQFAPWSSDIELSFYGTLASLKIDHDKLSDAPRSSVGGYEIRPSDAPERSARMLIQNTTFSSDGVTNTAPNRYRAVGMIRNMNTIEDYKNLDRTAVMNEAGKNIWDAIQDGSVLSNPARLSYFYAIFFADLKKYKFTYHFAFPAIHSDPSWTISDEAAQGIEKVTGDELGQLLAAIQEWKSSVDIQQHGFFLAKRVIADDSTSFVINSLSSFEDGFFDSTAPTDQLICFADPSTYPTGPGWPLRNLLALMKYRWKLASARVLCLRDTNVRPSIPPASIILSLSSPSHPTTTSEMPKVTGWERNEHSKVNSKSVDLSAYMDPLRLADQSVDLNLKLMKWRIAPTLDLDTVRSTSCLLLGAGTLGSYVSRNLLGWGVRSITFVDNGRVSFSNPVRQPLFSYTDCLNGGAPKAERAAAALKEIYPGVDAVGINMSVPMAGHPMLDAAEEARTRADFERLRELIATHEVIFLLMDTRESRWLPTLMGKAAGKLVVNAALGFDSYVVMRHGIETADPSTSLGCYFCNDVVAPADSMSDRTLDQQCTVTRPGVAALASALLVELVVSVLQHPDRAAAPAPATRASPRDPVDHPLGLIPHSIRGFLAAFDNLLVRGPAYNSCSACGPRVLDHYRADAWEFVRRAMNEKGYVEEVSGLAEVQRLAEEASAAMEREMEEMSIGDEDEGDGELL